MCSWSSRVCGRDSRRTQCAQDVCSLRTRSGARGATGVCALLNTGSSITGVLRERAHPHSTEMMLHMVRVQPRFGSRFLTSAPHHHTDKVCVKASHPLLRRLVVFRRLFSSTDPGFTRHNPPQAPNSNSASHYNFPSSRTCYLPPSVSLFTLSSDPFCLSPAPWTPSIAPLAQ